MKTASDIYVERLLSEKPKTTKGGIPIEVKNNGRTVITRSGRAWNNKGYSVYNPTDYPALFGWERVGRQPSKNRLPFGGDDIKLRIIVLRKGRDSRITLPATVDAYIKNAPLAIVSIYRISGKTVYYLFRKRIKIKEEVNNAWLYEDENNDLPNWLDD